MLFQVLFILICKEANHSSFTAVFEKFFPSENAPQTAVLIYFHRNIRCVECLETEEVLKDFKEDFNRENSCEFLAFTPVNLDSSVYPLLGKLPGIEGNTLVLALKDGREEISLRIFQRVVLYSGISNSLLDSIGEILISHIY